MSAISYDFCGPVQKMLLDPLTSNVYKSVPLTENKLTILILKHFRYVRPLFG